MAESPSVGRSGAIVASGTLVSRLLGFVNALILYNTIGAQGRSADAFTLANQLPNNIFTIIAGGTLTAVIVPAIVKATGHEDGGERFLNKLVTLGVSLFLGVTIAVTVAAPLVVHLYAQAGADGGRGYTEAQLQLAYGFAYWCLPQVFFYALFAVLSEVLNARGRFWPFAWAPVVNNVVFAAVLLTFQGVFGSAEGVDPAEWSPSMVALLAGGATLGIAIQSLVLVVAWRQAGIRFRPDFRFRGAGLSGLGKLAAWTLGAVVVGQAGGIIESRVVSLASGDASTATMTLSWLIFIMPFSLVTLSVATPYYTRMSGHHAAGDKPALGADLTSATNSVLLFQTFAAGALVVVAPWVATLFTKDPDARVGVWTVLSCYLIGLVPFSVAGIMLRGWYATNRNRTAFVLQLVQTILYVALLLLGVAHAPKDLIGPLTAASMATVLTTNAVISVWLMKRRLPTLRVDRIVGRFLWFLAAMIPAAAIGLGVDWLMQSTGAAAFPGGTWSGALVAALVAGILMLAVYVGVLWLTRNPELRGVLRPVLGRLGRRAE